ncbi:MAG: ABC transporter substrate-binding protein [Pseudomonadota bacterium]
MKKIFWVIILHLSFIPFPGCFREYKQPAGNGIVVGLEGNPTSLDPRFATGAHSERILPLLFNGLIRLDEGQAFVGDLAASWQSLDERTYIFQLRRGVTFHDGRELTALDVKYTFDYIREPKNLSPCYSAYSPIASIDCLGRYGIRFRLKIPYVSFLYQMNRGIVPAHLGDRRDFQDNPVGSGPFRFIRWEKGVRILLHSNGDYFEGTPRLQWIHFSIIPHTTTRLLEMKRGRIDLLQNAIPPYAVRFFKKMEGTRVITEPGINYKYIGYNLRDPILRHSDVRRAISHAIDRDRIIRYNLKGLAQKATGLLAPSNPVYEGDVMRYEYDPQRAKALLNAAGFPDPDDEGPLPRFKLSLKTSTDRESNEIAQVIVSQLAQVGIAVEKRGYEWGTFYGDIKKGNFQMYSLTWVGIVDPDAFHYVFHSEMIPPKGANRGFYRNPKLDTLIDQSRETQDPSILKGLYSRIQKILAEEAVYTSLWHPHNVLAVRDRFQGFRVYPGGQYTSLKDVCIVE